MEGLTSFLQVGGFVIAMLTIYRALSEYGKNNLFQRAKILEGLITRFKDPKLYISKRILDDFIAHFYENIDAAKADAYSNVSKITDDLTIVHSSLKTRHFELSILDNDPKYTIGGMKLEAPHEGDEWILKIVRKGAPKVQKFKFINLTHLLRSHKGSYVGDDEVYFRDSFDELLDFYSLLIYYLRNEIITIREVRAHFLVHLILVRDCVPLRNYIRIYFEENEFEWLFRQLPESNIQINTSNKKADKIEDLND
jgi:hypothetical protein